jgi:hypothetical protein
VPASASGTDCSSRATNSPFPGQDGKQYGGDRRSDPEILPKFFFSSAFNSGYAGTNIKLTSGNPMLHDSDRDLFLCVGLIDEVTEFSGG